MTHLHTEMIRRSFHSITVAIVAIVIVISEMLEEEWSMDEPING